MGANAGGTDPNSVDAMSQLLTDKPLVFTLKSKAMEAHDWFRMSSQEYLDSMKVSVYLQDAIKVILDRREERPL